MRTAVWVVSCLLAGVVAGCGTPLTTGTAATPSPHAPAAAGSASTGARPPAFSSTMVRTCIPESDPYVTLTVASRHPTLSIEIGHPLTTQGAGIPETVLSFAGTGGRVSVPIPTGVVFNFEGSGDLFGSLVDAHGTLWLLLYVASAHPTPVPVLKGPAVSSNRLVTWSVEALTVNTPAIQQALAAAKAAGWTPLTRVVARHHWTGIGFDGWLRVPLNTPLDIFNPTLGGTTVLEASAVSSTIPRQYAAITHNRCRTSAN